MSVVEGASERTIEEDDHKHSEKLESFLNAAFESKITSSVSVTHSFFLLRLRQAEKIHFQRISELSIMEEKVSLCSFNFIHNLFKEINMVFSFVVSFLIRFLVWNQIMLPFSMWSWISLALSTH